MKNTKVVLHSLFYSLGVVIYALSVAWVMVNGEKIFGPEDTFLAVGAFLLLFVVSASVVGLLVFGKPAKLFIEGMRKESLEHLFYIVGWLFILTLLIILIHAA